MKTEVEVKSGHFLHLTCRQFALVSAMSWVLFWVINREQDRHSPAFMGFTSWRRRKDNIEMRTVRSMVILGEGIWSKARGYRVMERILFYTGW